MKQVKVDNCVFKTRVSHVWSKVLMVLKDRANTMTVERHQSSLPHGPRDFNWRRPHYTHRQMKPQGRDCCIAGFNLKQCHQNDTKRERQKRDTTNCCYNTTSSCCHNNTTVCVVPLKVRVQRRVSLGSEVR